MAAHRNPPLLAPPAGMRDLLYPESAARRALGAALMRTFALYGYELVTTPPFEHADVIERGLDAVDRRDLLRFVEPETGEVALLRPDITPQIARIVASSLRGRPGPWRLAYDGTIVRRRRGRARRQRQIAQAGAELIGLGGPAGDAEVIALAVDAARAAGLPQVRVELAHVGLGRSALSALAEEDQEAAAEALAAKDVALLTSLLEGEAQGLKAHVLGLVGLDGPADEVLKEARARFRNESDQEPLDELTAVIARLGLPGSLVGLDLSDVRGASYYTGVSFTLLAPGPGEPIAAGGRYDGLLARFDHPAPATGFALDIENLAWALAEAGTPARAPKLVRVVVPVDGEPAQALLVALRAAGIAAAALPADADALAYARAWGYDAVARAGETARAERVDGRGAVTLPAGDPARTLLALLDGAG